MLGPTLAVLAELPSNQAMELEKIEQAIAELDARAATDHPKTDPLEAIASGTDEAWLGKVQEDIQRVASAIADEANRIIDALLQEYQGGDEAQRDTIRRLLSRYRKFTFMVPWATDWSSLPAIGRLRTQLLWISMSDRNTDSRDRHGSVEDLCVHARDVGVDIAPVLEEVAAISRDEIDVLGLSTRKIMLNARASHAKSERPS